MSVFTPLFAFVYAILTEFSMENGRFAVRVRGSESEYSFKLHQRVLKMFFT